MSLKLCAAALLVGVAIPAGARVRTPPPPPLVTAPLIMVSDPGIVAYYTRFGLRPIWFRGTTQPAAAAKLVEILRRAPFDGFAQGPQLAQTVEAAIARAASNQPADLAFADQTLSLAWVTYVDALRRPTTGMIYAYPSMRPQGTRADQILLTAAASTDLSAYLEATSRLNPIYAQIRDAGFAAAKVSGNLTPDPRLIANLDRARSIPAGGKFVMVDVAAQRLLMFENGQPIDSMKVVVGKNEYPTPMIASIIHYAAFNPYWDVPDHLIRQNIAPAVVKAGPSALKVKGYEVMSDWGEQATVVPAASVDWKAIAAGTKQVRLRQLPGTDNSLGKVKFPFPSGEGVYLHDTPHKEYFLKNVRTLSNGCIRLEDADRFARWLFGRSVSAPSTAPEQFVTLPQGMPIVVTYLTAQVNDGKLTYLTDFYGLDRPGATKVASTTKVASGSN